MDSKVLQIELTPWNCVFLKNCDSQHEKTWQTTISRGNCRGTLRPAFFFVPMVPLDCDNTIITLLGVCSGYHATILWFNGNYASSIIHNTHNPTIMINYI